MEIHEAPPMRYLWWCFLDYGIIAGSSCLLHDFVLQIFYNEWMSLVGYSVEAADIGDIIMCSFQG